MNYQEVMTYLDHAKVFGSILGLSTMRELLKELHHPEKGLPAVHVAGTNGKGSTAAYLSEMLTAAGCRTGLYISPFIQRFGERIQVDGTLISRDEIAELMTRVIAAAESISRRGVQSPTVFELITAMGFLQFREKNCDIAVVEVGLGGRLDATNVIERPEAAVITHIGLDHTQVLGNTIAQIAAEKGGIVKSGCDTVMLRQSEEAMETVEKICRKKNAPLHWADASTAVLRALTVDGLVFDWEEYEGLRTSMTGLHQMCNAVTAVEAARVLGGRGWGIGEREIRAGLKSAKCVGRLEVLSRSPMVLVDGAHNPQGAKALMESLRVLFPGKKITFVVGTLADKDYRAAVAEAIPLAGRFVAVTPPVHRALGAEELAAVLREAGTVPVSVCPLMEDALRLVLESAGADDVICIFGSLYQIGDVRAFFGLAENEDWKE